MSDPHLAAVAAFVESVVQQVRAGELPQADAYAVLAADTLGLSLQDHVAPDTADELLGMAQAFAMQRYALVNAAALAATLPNTVAELEDTGDD